MVLFAILVIASSLAYLKDTKEPVDRINGVCFVAPPRPIQPISLKPITTVNADWIAITPYGFSRRNSPKVVFNHPNQWWGERVDGTIKTISYAQSMGLKIMLKPHIWVMGDGWAGEFELSDEAQWQIWESSYSDYILRFASIADSMNIDMLCIGTEYKKVVQKRPEFWSKLIKNVKKRYTGKLTYAANWDNFETVTFWDELDFIGIDAYFPLCDSITPNVDILKQNWEKTANSLRRYSERNNKQILFTEYGYRSMNRCAGGHWELDQQDLQPNMVAQMNALEALYETFWDKDWMAGGFIWKWYANHDFAGGQNDSHYTPQNKPAQAIIKKWYGK